MGCKRSNYRIEILIENDWLCLRNAGLSESSLLLILLGGNGLQH